jgi:hypothetical protein
MCVDHKITCNCGKNSASFNFKDDLLPPEVVNRLYCPACSSSASYKPESMIADNGWIIDYNMEVARFMAQKVASAGAIVPGFLFDEGYCTWRGIYPNDHIDSARERDELVKLAKTDPRRYFEELKTWGNRRMERLAREGWRKAHETESVSK